MPRPSKRQPQGPPMPVSTTPWPADTAEDGPEVAALHETVLTLHARLEALVAELAQALEATEWAELRLHKARLRGPKRPAVPRQSQPVPGAGR